MGALKGGRMNGRSIVVCAAPVALALACGGDSTSAGSASSTESGSATTTTMGTTSGVLDSTGPVDETANASSSSTGPGMIEPAPLEAGVAVRYLDRPVGTSMAGFGNRNGGHRSTWSDAFFASRGFYSLPTIKAMALRADQEELVLVKLPIMSSESGITDAIVAKLRDQHGIDLSGRVITGATHTHHMHARYWRLPDILANAGADTADEEIIDIIASSAVETIIAAREELAPAQWAYGIHEDWDPTDLVYHDRRGENDFLYGKDPRLTILAVQRPDGTPLAAVLNFGMHGTLLDEDNELLTEDAPGGLEVMFEERFFAAHGTPILGMFMQAGGGDAAPGGGQLGHGGIARAEVLGDAAAPSLLELYGQLQWRDEITLDVQSQRIELRYETFGYDKDEEFTGTWQGSPIDYEWGGWECKSPAVPQDSDPNTTLEGMPKGCIPANFLLGKVPHAEAHQTYLSAAKLDELFLVTLPGEPNASAMFYLREELAKRDATAAVLGIGYSQDHLLYLSHPDDWYQGGYETEQSLWGPYAARTLIDRQMEVVEQLMGTEDLPPFVEEAPNLAEPTEWEPREHEGSDNPGTSVQDVSTGMMRTEVVRFGFEGGDPALGAPRVRVQVDPGDGNFVDVPSLNGWPGAALDNSRYDMITHYDPTPTQSSQILDSRAHVWRVDWELPAELPAATYRLVATGPWWSGRVETFEVASSPFAVGQHDGAELDVQRTDTVLALRLTLAPTVTTTEESWPVAGWRVLDRSVGPSQRITVRGPLSLSFTFDGGGPPMSYTAEFDATTGAHVFDLADAGIDPASANLEVSAHLVTDVDPDPITAAVP